MCKDVMMVVRHQAMLRWDNRRGAGLFILAFQI